MSCKSIYRAGLAARIYAYRKKNPTFLALNYGISIEAYSAASSTQ
jgi:hypothetical protein